MRRNGFIFSLDAIAAVTVIAVSIAAMFLIGESSRPEAARFKHMNSISRDMISMLEKAKVSEASDFPAVAARIADGRIRAEDLDKKLVDLIGSYFSAGNYTEASAVLSEIFLPFLPSNAYYNITFDNQTLISNSLPHISTVATRAVVSGYLLGKPTSGYISRAWLGDARGNVTDVIDISPLGSGFSSEYSSVYGNLTFIKHFNLSSVDNLTAILYFGVHQEGGAIFIYINGARQTIPAGNACYMPTDACFDKIPMNSSSFKVGQNNLTVTLGTPPHYHTHTHPGFLLLINYNDNRQVNFVQGSVVYEMINLTEVRGRPAAWETFPFSIPEGAKVNSASVYIKTEGVEKRGEIWVNDDRIWYNTTAGPLGTLNSAGVTKNAKPYLNINSTNHSTGETDTISLFMDIPGTASGNAEDYPVSGATGFANISGISYVLLNYTLANPIVLYNHVPVTQTYEIDALDGQGNALIKKTTITLPNATLVSAYFHDVQRFSYKVAVAVWKNGTEAEPVWYSGNMTWSNYQIFKSPNARNIPSSLYIPKSRLASPGVSVLKIRDGFDGGSSGNYIMTNSTVEYTILAPASVPYGDAFPNATAASDDAKARLAAALAAYGITGTPASDTANIAGISWLWGPAELKVIIGI